MDWTFVTGCVAAALAALIASATSYIARSLRDLRTDLASFRSAVEVRLASLEDDAKQTRRTIDQIAPRGRIDSGRSSLL